MKKYNKLFLILISILLLNCSKSSTDDGGNNNPTPDNQTVDKSANLLATGASSSDILGNANFDNLLIEAAFVEGFRPTAEAMDEFVTFLSERTFKQNISIQYKQLESPDEETLTLQEIADLESENRTVYNDGNTLAIYIYFADAPSDDDDEEEGLVTLGAVYRNTSMVIYEKTIKSLAGRSLTITTADVEIATLNHEFGHLFGLVNLGLTPVNDHEDPEAENHCSVEGCLMRAELQFGGIAGKSHQLDSKDNILVPGCTLSGNSVLKILEHKTSKNMPTVDLDAECILDLQSNGGK
ncbi:hypothetical protein GGR42_003173 [Saonia flava]|uniref:Membrane metalloprotease n=1 Tax=Saonia flava TaxID=523696 RepID=A0A846R151_9FLAO|nr:hypothetical protein [Saonia flava]NJB72682.1 hypothetical protein [Saonia flava]